MAGWKDTIQEAPKTSWRDSIQEDGSEEPSELESGVRGIAQGLSMGFADEITGALESAAGSLGLTDQDKTYEQARDESRANYKRAEEVNPKSYTAGQIAGAVGTAALPVVGGAASIGKLAAQGAIQGLGSSEADLTSGDTAEILNAAKDTAIGGVTGAAIGGIGKGLSKLAPSSERVAQELLESKAGQKVMDIAEDVSNPLLSLPGASYETLPGKALNVSEGIAGRLENLGNVNENVGAGARKAYNALKDGDIAGLLKSAGGGLKATKGEVLKSALTSAAPKLPEMVNKPLTTKLGDMALGATLMSGTGVGSKIATASGIAKPLSVGLKAINSAVKDAANNLSVQSVETLAPVIGKYGKVLLDAAQRGGQSLAATDFILQQKDPEYREMMKAIKEGGQDEQETDQ